MLRHKLEVSGVAHVWFACTYGKNDNGNSSPSVLVQRQLEKVRLAANEWVLLFWLRLVLRVSLV
jgi:hypothetical protein